jgi:hypothetical protein
MQSEKITRIDTVQGDTKTTGTLKQIVRHALLQILKDSEASAAAKASAGRTLLQYFTEESTTRRRGADMTAAELEQAIASHAHPNGAGDESES